MTQESELPEDVRVFLRLRLETYEQLELLRLLHREPARQWSATQLCAQLRLSPDLADSAAQALLAVGLADRSATDAGVRYVYRQADPVTQATVERVLQLYRDQPIQILKLMSDNAIERVRTGALRAFADAFVLKKDPDRG